MVGQSQLETGGPAGSSCPADSLNHMLLVGEKKALQDAIDTGEKWKAIDVKIFRAPQNCIQIVESSPACTAQLVP